MKKTVAFCLAFQIIVAWLSHAANADPLLLSPDDICVDGVVSKYKLAVTFGGARPFDNEHKPWQTYFKDSSFCEIPAGCDQTSTSKTCKAALKCQDAQNAAIN